MTVSAAAVAAVVAAGGCSFGGSPQPGVPSDADLLPPPPDADPLRPDARRPPDAAPVPDATPGTPDAPPPPPDAALATCPGYAPIAGGFPAGATYRGVANGAAWQTARGNCQADGGELVVIDNATEADAVSALVQDPRSPFFWIGVFDPSGGPDNDFVTVLGGSPAFAPWGPSQPNGGSQDCVLLGDSGSPHEFWDWACGAPQEYVCECLP